MRASISMSDLAEAAKSPLEELRTTGEKLDPKERDSCAVFGRCVIAAETALKMAYKLAAMSAKRSQSLEEEAQIWSDMSQLCDSMIGALKALKDKFPREGTPELYELAIDYKLASEKRSSRTVEAIQCQSIPMPEGLFPRTT